MRLSTAAAAQACGGILSQEVEAQLQYAAMLIDVSKNCNSPLCQVIEHEDENISKLGLPFMHDLDQDCTLDDFIAHHCETEDIENYQCDICNGRTTGMKETDIIPCLPIVCVVLCHKKQDGRSIKSSVQFSVSGFNIVTEDDVQQYNLIGTIHHTPHGSDHGHYTSFCQSQHSRNWFDYNDDSVSISKFTNMKQKDRVLKVHTKTATILFYVSKELQTHNRSQVPIDLQNDTDDYANDTGEEGGEDGTSESKFNNQGGGEEDDTESTSSSESELNNCISQEFLQRVEGHYCSVCQEQHYLTSTDLATFETEAKCKHVYCYIRLSSRKAASANGILTCPQCNCIAPNINHHQPIRLDDGLTYFRNTPQVVLGCSEGHQCGICLDDFNLYDTDLGALDTEANCRHIFCHDCLLKHKRQRIKDRRTLD